MASLDGAEKLLGELRAAAFPAAKRDLAEVREFAASQGEDRELLWWDVAYWCGGKGGAAGVGPGRLGERRREGGGWAKLGRGGFCAHVTCS
jgi:hypothetical protein